MPPAAAAAVAAAGGSSSDGCIYVQEVAPGSRPTDVVYHTFHSYDVLQTPCLFGCLVMVNTTQISRSWSATAATVVAALGGGAAAAGKTAAMDPAA